MKTITNIDPTIISVLKQGGVGIMPTDTIYGLVGCAWHKDAVQRIFALKQRAESKPFIVLIASYQQLADFGVNLGPRERLILKACWPGPISVILECAHRDLIKHLRPKDGTLAFRWPADKWLQSLVKKMGPLVAPSANWEGYPPAVNLEQAKGYFDDKVDFYLDAGTRKSKASTLIAIKSGCVIIERQGKAGVKPFFKDYLCSKK